MKKASKHLLKVGLALVLTLALASVAFAADAGTISVQLNGEPLTFEAVAPVSRDNLTFVPIRTVFEALGATVSYDAATETVTAVRGDTSVSFVVGKTEATVKTGEESKTVDLGSAPFEEGGSTYVPARFTAETLGYNVGWDADDNTLLIDDVDALITESGATYDIIDKYSAYSRTLEKENMALSGTFTVKASAQNGDTPVDLSMDGTVSGLSNASGAAFDVALKTNLADALAASGEELSDEDKAAIAALAEIKISYIVNLDTNTLYLSSPLLSSALGATDENTWFSVDLSSLLAQSGIKGDLGALQSAEAAGFKDSLSAVLKGIKLTDKDATTKDILAVVNAIVSDQALAEDEDGNYTSNFELSQDGVTGSIKTTFKASGDDINAMDMALALDLGAQGKANVNVSVDKDGKTTIAVTVDSDAVKLEMNMPLEIKESKDAPVLTPAEGSTVVPLDLSALISSATTATTETSAAAVPAEETPAAPAEDTSAAA